jgi:hypothetical protein
MRSRKFRRITSAGLCRLNMFLRDHKRSVVRPLQQLHRRDLAVLGEAKDPRMSKCQQEDPSQRKSLCHRTLQSRGMDNIPKGGDLQALNGNKEQLQRDLGESHPDLCLTLLMQHHPSRWRDQPPGDPCHLAGLALSRIAGRIANQPLLLLLGQMSRDACLSPSPQEDMTFPLQSCKTIPSLGNLAYLRVVLSSLGLRTWKQART